jgi:hypothetical protein
MRPDFDKAPDRGAIHGEAVLVAQDLRDFTVTLPLPAKITDNFRDRPELALERLSALEPCRSRHPDIEAENIATPGASE